MTVRSTSRREVGSAAIWLACSVGALLTACGGPQEPDANRQASAGSGAAQAEPSVEDLTGAVVRPDLLDVLGRSAGDFLRLVELEAELADGAFAGWRIVTLPEGMPAWIDVQRGDVVTAVNGMPVERPDDAQAIWETLQVASEVRIDLTRAGDRRSVRIPVEDVAEGGTRTAPAPAPELEPTPAGPTE